MAETKKKDASKAPVTSTKQGAAKAAKVADQVFKKLKKHFEPKKVDAWQKKWLAVPENRKKYEKLSDAPGVASEEFMAMADDIIQFAQGQEGGKSHLFKKAKAGMADFMKNPVQFMQEKVAKGKEMAKKAQGAAGDSKKKAGKAAKK